MADGIMAIWMDCDAEHLADFDAWYDRQHLYERTSTPGFVTGTRYRAIRGRPAFGAVYETESPAVMRSEAYLARLEKPTAWTSRVMPHFRNTIRTVFSRTLDFGASRGAMQARYEARHTEWPCILASTRMRHTCVCVCVCGGVGA